MKKEIYWHLPGLCSLRFLNQILFNLMEKHPESFYEGYKIASVYGTFPNAIWNGGRSVFGLSGKSDIEKILTFYNSKNIPVRFTWTNTLLEEKHFQDTYCNLIMQMANNGMNQVLANVPALEDYLRENYPNFKVISSTTKRLLDPEALRAEMEKDYHLVVLDYDLNHNEDVLSMLEPYANRVEILVNEICVPGCPMRQAHYANQSKAQLEFDMQLPFKCPHDTSHRDFEECKKRPAFISREQIQEYAERGFVNFKIVGRGLPMEFAKEAYLYFLVKEEYQTFIRTRMDKALAELTRKPVRR